MILPIALSLIAVASAYPAQTTVTVQEGNVCFDFIGEFGIDSLATLYANNPSINKDCTNLQIGQILDVSQTSALTPQRAPKDNSNVSGCTSPYTVEAGDFCLSILADYGNEITLAQLYQTNPAINSDCTNLMPAQILCLDGINSPAVAPSPGTCSTTYTVASGDSCFRVIGQVGITLQQLYFLNPSINSMCSNLQINQVLCIVEVAAAAVSTTASVMAPATTSASAQPTTQSMMTIVQSTTAISSPPTTSSATLESTSSTMVTLASSTTTSSTLSASSTPITSSMTPDQSSTQVMPTTSSTISTTVSSSTMSMSMDMATSSAAQASSSTPISMSMSSIAPSTTSSSAISSSASISSSAVVSSAPASSSSVATVTSSSAVSSPSQNSSAVSCPSNSTPDSDPRVRCSCSSPPQYNFSTNTCDDCPAGSPVYLSDYNACCPTAMPYWDTTTNGCTSVYPNPCPQNSNSATSTAGNCDCTNNVADNMTFYDNINNVCTGQPESCPEEGVFPDCSCANDPMGMTVYDTTNNICVTPGTDTCPEAGNSPPSCDCSQNQFGSTVYDIPSNSCQPPQCPVDAAGNYPTCDCTVNGNGNNAYDSNNNVCVAGSSSSAAPTPTSSGMSSMMTSVAASSAPATMTGSRITPTAT